MEIISGVERRRHWRVEDKLRIVAEAESTGACFAGVARRHEVSRSVLWAWRKQVRSGALALEPAPVFLPVQVVQEPVPMASPLTLQGTPTPAEPVQCRAVQQIEIVLPDGTALRVSEAVGTAALRRVLSALRG
jgi:transposase